MAMGIYRGVNAAARKVTDQYRGVNSIARKIVKEYRGVNNVARQCFNIDTELYLIKDGIYQETFTTTSVWEPFPAANGTNFTTTQGNGYIQIYNMGYNAGGIITSDIIDLTNYKTLNIECDVSLYSSSPAYLNRAAFGVYDSIPTAFGYGSVWSKGSGTIVYADALTSGPTNGFVSISTSIDISSYNVSGHIFAYTTSYNLPSDYSYMRIKNLWLS